MASNKNYQRRIENKTKKVAKKMAKKHPVLAIFLVIVFIAIAVGGYYAYNKYFKKPNGTPLVTDGDISFHFLMLGNDKDGDSIYIKAGDNDILIDAGSDTNSSDDIINYVDDYCKDKSLEFVIATHADKDHIASFGCNNGIFDYYDCKTIIDFPMTDKTTDIYNKYLEKRDLEVTESGAKHYSALECYNNENGANRVYDLGNSVTMEILYNYFYENSDNDENNYSVCVLFKHGERKFLFTGDLEKEGEEKLVEKYPNLGQVELFKAGHHGSKTSSNTSLLQIIRPKICVVSCSASNTGYKFPTNEFVERISTYTTKVYVTTQDNLNGDGYVPYNGNIVVNSNTKGVEVICSNNDTLLKDSTWFKENRNMPTAWVS